MQRKITSESAVNMFRFALIVTFILLAVAARILPHPWNFTPIGAMAIFSGAKLANKWTALLIPWTALFLGDLFSGLYNLMLIVYLSFCVSVLIGRYFRNRQTMAGISLATFAGAAQFFLITNFAVWVFGHTPYAKSLSGLLACYVAGIPLFGNTLASDAFYASILFGGFALVERFSTAFRSDQSALAA